MFLSVQQIEGKLFWVNKCTSVAITSCLIEKTETKHHCLKSNSGWTGKWHWPYCIRFIFSILWYVIFNFLFSSLLCYAMLFYSMLCCVVLFLKSHPCFGWNYWQWSLISCPPPVIIYVFPTHTSYYRKPLAVSLNIFTGKWSILSLVGTRHWLMAGSFGFWQGKPQFKL